MTKHLWALGAAAFVAMPIAASAQSPKAATYITDEQVKADQRESRRRSPDRQRRHRQAERGGRHRPSRRDRCAAAGGRGRAGAGWRRGRRRQSRAVSGRRTPPAGGTPAVSLTIDQTETYIIVSGGGTLVTGGHIVNGRKSAPESAVTKVLNGPSCSGMIAGADVVKKVVKTGDIIIIPAGVPHGWTEITDHVDYLSVRPDPDRVLPAGYVNPIIKK